MYVSLCVRLLLDKENYEFVYNFLNGHIVCFGSTKLIVYNFFGLVYFVSNFRSIKFFMAFKMRKMLGLQIFLQIVDVVSNY